VTRRTDASGRTGAACLRDGFSYVQESQPIFDRHCVSCYNESQIAKSKLSLTGELARPESMKLITIQGKVDHSGNKGLVRVHAKSLRFFYETRKLSVQLMGVS
jgi:hypothetical protein